MECRGFESHPRQLIFLRKSDCLGCAVLLCLVCLFDLACFFLSSFSSLIICILLYSHRLIQNLLWNAKLRFAEASDSSGVELCDT